MDTREYGNSLGIYLVTFWIEASTAIFRALLLGLLFLPFGFLLGLIYLLISGGLVRLGMFGGGDIVFQSFLVSIWFSLLLGGLLAFVPLGLSLLSYWGAGGGYGFTRFALGARPPSVREQVTLEQELLAIQSALNQEILTFSRILVIDTPLERIYTIGSTLYISSEAVRSSRHLGALLAHELGHLNHDDGGLVLSLRRLVFPLFYLFLGNVTSFSTGRFGSGRGQKSDPTSSDIYYSMVNAVIFFLFATLGGGLGVWLCSFWWADYFRRRDYLADRFVVECGLQDQLLDYLERNLFYDVSVPYMLGWQPANELRVDRLINPSPALLAAGVTSMAESATRKYGGLFLISFVAAIFFGSMVPLGSFGFWSSFVLFIALGLFFRADADEIRALLQWFFQTYSQAAQYVRMTGLAFLVTLFISLLSSSSWLLFWLMFIFIWAGLYGLRWWALGLHDLAAVLSLLYAHASGYYTRLTNPGVAGSAATSGVPPAAPLPTSPPPPSNPGGPQPSGAGRGSPPGQQPFGRGSNPFTPRQIASRSQSVFQLRMVQIAAQRGPDAVSLQDIRNILVDIVAQQNRVDVAWIQAEIKRLIDEQYVSLRPDIRTVLGELHAETRIATAKDVVDWLDQRLGTP